MLSVVIPTRDRREVLLETLRTLEAQHAPEGGFEVIVVDNGSSDGTPDAVEELRASARMPLELVREPGTGPPLASSCSSSATTPPRRNPTCSRVTPTCTPGTPTGVTRSRAGRPGRRGAR
jgi:glycosyltransferase involved in cell wall biosynthesis